MTSAVVPSGSTSTSSQSPSVSRSAAGRRQAESRSRGSTGSVPGNSGSGTGASGTWVPGGWPAGNKSPGTGISGDVAAEDRSGSGRGPAARPAARRPGGGGSPPESCGMPALPERRSELSGLCCLSGAVWAVLCAWCRLGGAVSAVATRNRGPESRAGSPPPRRPAQGPRTTSPPRPASHGPATPAMRTLPAPAACITPAAPGRAGGSPRRIPGRLNCAATSSVIQG